MPTPFRLAWCTDLHLDHAREAPRTRFRDVLTACEPDAVVITGDTTVAAGVDEHLRFLLDATQAPIYVVLGNHDFWGSNLPEVRFRVGGHVARARAAGRVFVHLNRAGVVALTPDTALVGHDGWYDGRVGAFDTSEAAMGDFQLIDEFARFTRRFERLHLMRQLAQQAVDELRPALTAALAAYPRVIIATHVPPWRGAAWHAGLPSDAEFAPWFVSAAMGEMIDELADAHPTRELLVLCGHTHGRGEHRPRPNVRCLTGGAEYGVPRIEDVLDLGATTLLEPPPSPAAAFALEHGPRRETRTAGAHP